MNIKLLDLLTRLKIYIDADKNIIRLNELDLILKDADDLILIKIKKDKIKNSIDILKEDEVINKEELLRLQESLVELNLEFNSHLIVKEYNEVYNEVEKIYNKINSTLFDPYSNKRKLCKND